MKTIKGTEKVEMIMGRWSPSNLAVIEALELKSGWGLSGTTLAMNALFQQRGDRWPDFDKMMFRVVIVFQGVGNLRLKDFGGGPVQIMGFDIHFVGDRGQDGNNFEIVDYEDGRIEFNCASISIQSAELASE